MTGRVSRLGRDGRDFVLTRRTRIRAVDSVPSMLRWLPATSRARAGWPLQRHPYMFTALAAVALAVWIRKLVALARSTGRYADHWSQSPAHAGGLVYVALGDSAAQGIGASAPEKGYVGLLAQRLRDTTREPVEVLNLSRSGARLRDVIDEQLPALAAVGRRADVVTVAVGGNDMWRYDHETFASEADQLTAALPAGAYVADVPYFMHGRWERDAQLAGDRLRDSAARRNLPTVGLHEAQRAQGWRAMLNQFAADWFHPNDRGHRVWADAFWGRVQGDVLGLRPRRRLSGPFPLPVGLQTMTSGQRARATITSPPGRRR